MTDKMAAAVWTVFATAPIAYPNTAWRIMSTDFAIMVSAQRGRFQIGHAFAYIQFQDHVCPDQWLSWELSNMARELDRAERT